MERKPIHQMEMVCQGEQYRVAVYQLAHDRFVATTVLTEQDVIEVDGSSLEEVLERHCSLLPLALQSRALCGPRQ